MNTSKLPKYVFQNPVIRSVTFNDQNFINIINLSNSGKKHTGYAVYCSSGKSKIFATSSEASKRFMELITANKSGVLRFWKNN